jgi:hypothetical protein
VQVSHHSEAARAIMEKSYLYPALTLNVSNKWRTSGQLDLQYHSYDIDFQASNQKVSTDFLKILISLNYEFTDIVRVRPFLRIGASYNKYYYRLKGEIDGPHPVASHISFNSTIHSQSHLNYLAGLGGLLSIGKGSQIRVEMLYDSNFLKNNKSGGDFANHTNSILLQFGIVF